MVRVRVRGGLGALLLLGKAHRDQLLQRRGLRTRRRGRGGRGRRARLRGALRDRLRGRVWAGALRATGLQRVQLGLQLLRADLQRVQLGLQLLRAGLQRVQLGLQLLQPLQDGRLRLVRVGGRGRVRVGVRVRVRVGVRVRVRVAGSACAACAWPRPEPPERT